MNFPRNADRAPSVLRHGVHPEVPPPPVDPAQCAFFLDVDGTLLPLADHPDAVTVTEPVLNTLKRLRRVSQGALALVSGRTLAELDRLFAPEVFPAIGQHGSERRGIDGKRMVDDAHQVSLDRLRPRIQALVDPETGSFIEDKGLSLTLHLRGTEAQSRRLIEALRAACTDCPDVRLLDGKRVLEIRSRRADKGRAVEDFLTMPPFAGRLPVYLGDDVADESAFVKVDHHAGVSIKVGPGPSGARYRLADPQAAVSCLDRWAHRSNHDDP